MLATEEQLTCTKYGSYLAEIDDEEKQMMPIFFRFCDFLLVTWVGGILYLNSTFLTNVKFGTIPLGIAVGRTKLQQLLKFTHTKIEKP